MKPDRSDYEIWLCDWLDGKLSSEQVEELKVFLYNNPDLLDELNGIQLVSLTPPELVFEPKNRIRKSFKDITDTQFEYLCIASLENDLSGEQKAELNEITEKNETKKRTFELIQKLKLKPQKIVFRRKNSVKRLTAFQKTFRLTAAGLSAAAAIVILMIYLFPPENNHDILRKNGRITVLDTIPITSRPSGEIAEMRIASAAGKSLEHTEIKRTSSPAGSTPAVTPADAVNIENRGALQVFRREEPLSPVRTGIPDDLFDTYNPSSALLQPYYAGNIPTGDEDYRSNVDRFVARLFHRVIMRDTTAGDRPVGSYELASAGVTGLNKLFGWEMALQKYTGDKGEIRSYYFTSKLLKFNAPVRKTADKL